MVERLIDVEDVVGSSPAARTKIMKKEKTDLGQQGSTKKLETEKQFEHDPFILSNEFTKNDELAFRNAKEEVLFKDPGARVEIQKLSDGKKSAAILDGKGKIIFFTKWEYEVTELEKYGQRKPE